MFCPVCKVEYRFGFSLRRLRCRPSRRVVAGFTRKERWHFSRRQGTSSRFVRANEISHQIGSDFWVASVHRHVRNPYYRAHCVQPGFQIPILFRPQLSKEDLLLFGERIALLSSPNYLRADFRMAAWSRSSPPVNGLGLDAPLDDTLLLGGHITRVTPDFRVR